MRTDYIKPSVYNKLYMILQYENALALRLSLETGMRISDVLNLRVEQLEGRTITYTISKTKKEDKKVISADLAKRLLQISGKNWLFTGRFGNKPRSRSAVWKDIKKASKILNLSENVGCHSARKTYAVEKFHQDGIAETQKALAHDRVNTTMIYAFSDMLVNDKHPNAVVDDELAERIADKVMLKLKENFSD